MNVKVREPVDPTRDPAVRDAMARAESELGDRGRVVLRASGTEPVDPRHGRGRGPQQVDALAEPARGRPSAAELRGRLSAIAREPALRCGATARKLPARSPGTSAFHGEIRVTRKPLIAGNWKMHGSLAESRAARRRHCAPAVSAGAPRRRCCCARRTSICPRSSGWLRAARSRSARRTSPTSRARARTPARSRARCCATSAAAT